MEHCSSIIMGAKIIIPEGMFTSKALFEVPEPAVI